MPVKKMLTVCLAVLFLIFGVCRGEEAFLELDIDASISAVGNDASAKAALESECLTILEASQNWMEIYRSVRILAVIGTQKSLPALSAMLADPSKTHLARIALESIPGEEAGAALRDGLDKVSGKPKIGIISSLGARREDKAVPQLITLSQDPDKEISQAAFFALGRISGAESMLFLKAQLDNPDRDRAILAAEALLTALESPGDPQNAAKDLCQTLMAPSWPEHVRSGAFTRLLALDQEQAPGRILDSIHSEDNALRSTAIAAVISLPGTAVTSRFADALPSMNPELQALMIEALAKRSEPIPVSVLYNCLESPAEPVRIAAMKALAVNGDKDSISRLGKVLASSSSRAEKLAIVETLRRLEGPDVNAALIAFLGEADQFTRPDIMEALVQRGATESMDALIAQTMYPEIRGAAFIAIGQLATVEHLPTVAGLLSTLEGSEGRTEAENAVVALCRRIADAGASIAISKAVYGDWPNGTFIDVTDKIAQGVKNNKLSLVAQNHEFGDPAPGVVKKLHVEYADGDVSLTKTVLEGETLNLSAETIPKSVIDQLQSLLTGASTSSAKVSFLRIFSRLGVQDAFEIVVSYLKDPDPAVMNGAVRAISEWPNTRALKTLAEMATTSPDPTQKNIALRGCVRILRLGDTPIAESLEIYKSLLDTSPGADERKRILSGLGETGSADAIPLIRSVANDANVQSEMQSALDRIKTKVGEAAFNEAMNKLPSDAIVDTAFVPIFDGTSLNGWSGDPSLWRVEEGCIVGESTEQNPVKVNTFLIWEGGDLENFEIKFRYRIDSDWANSGIQVRSERFETYRVRGYQPDISTEDWITGICYEEGGRGILARRGQKVELGKGPEPVITQTADENALGDYIQPKDWNDYHVRVRGNQIYTRINGHKMHEVIDTASEARLKGIIAFQIHAGPPMKIRFADIMIKRLPPTNTQ